MDGSRPNTHGRGEVHADDHVLIPTRRFHPSVVKKITSDPSLIFKTSLTSLGMVILWFFPTLTEASIAIAQSHVIRRATS